MGTTKINDKFFLIGITSITHIVAMAASLRAYQSTENSFVASLEYTYLVFALIIDYIVCQHNPNVLFSRKVHKGLDKVNISVTSSLEASVDKS